MYYALSTSFYKKRTNVEQKDALLYNSSINSALRYGGERKGYIR